MTQAELIQFEDWGECPAWVGGEPHPAGGTCARCDVSVLLAEIRRLKGKLDGYHVWPDGSWHPIEPKPSESA